MSDMSNTKSLLIEFPVGLLNRQRFSTWNQFQIQVTRNRNPERIDSTKMDSSDSKKPFGIRKSFYRSTKSNSDGPLKLTFYLEKSSFPLICRFIMILQIPYDKNSKFP